MEIYVAEVAPGGEWDYAFWNYDPDGIMVAFHCPQNRSVWTPVETPCFTGEVHPYEETYSKKPWHSDPDPK